MEIFVLWVLFSVAVGAWARAWNRSFVGYLAFSMLLSPAIGAIAIMIDGPKKDTDGRPKKGYDIYAPKPGTAKGTAKVLQGRGDGERLTYCPHCEHRQTVTFEDARAEKMTCKKCWKTFPIYVP